MTLPLTVPPLSTRVITDVELRPAMVQEWLATLPLLNVVETTRKLFATLTVYNRIEIEPATRFALLELLRYPVQQLCGELQKQVTGLPLPLSEKHKTLAEQNRQFQLEMAIGYKRMLLQSPAPQAPKNHERERRQRALVVQRAIRYLNGALLASYQSYSPYPLGSWQEIHALYRHAEAEWLTEFAVPDELNTTLSETTVAHVYLQALLLDLSSPYHLAPRMVGRIQHYLDRYAGLARLLPAAAQFDPACQFLIDQDADRSGIIYTADAELTDPSHYRLLNTVDLARQLHTHLTALQHGETPPLNGLHERFFEDDAFDLLRRLINAFGLHPKRTFRRANRAKVSVDALVGLRGIHYWVNGGAPFTVSSTFVGPMSQRTQLGAPDTRRVATHNPELDFSAWDVLDESAGGMALGKKGLVPSPVRVGELAAVRPAGQKAWQLGVIRWVKSPSPSEVQYGVQWIAPQTEALVVKTVAEDTGKESDFLPALLLPGVEALKLPPSLLTGRGVYKPERDIYVDNGFRLYRVRITQPDEITHSFERFQYRVLDN
jgi:hypothetical protein